jgi:myb proto-oncogene protein
VSGVIGFVGLTNHFIFQGRTEDAVKLRWKTLNPNQKTNAKPGRPRLMPGIKNKALSTAPPNLAKEVEMVAAPVPLMTMPHKPNAEFHQETVISLQPGLELHGALPDPTTLGHDIGIDKNQLDSAKDAVILQQLLRSQSNSLLSFGSTRGLSSFTDLSPDELLASGELDEMLRAVSLENVSSSKMMDSQSSINAANLADSCTKAMESLDRQKDKNFFPEFIDEPCSESGGSVIRNFSLSEPTPYAVYSNSTNGNVNLCQYDNTSVLYPLDYAKSSHPPTKRSISSVVGLATSGIDDLLDPDMMRPFRNGVQF